jgi:predicted methyltransferase
VNSPIVLSHFQAQPLLVARDRGSRSAIVSPDLGISNVDVQIEPDRVIFPGCDWVTWDAVADIAASETACFAIGQGSATKVQAYSPAFDRFYSLMPTPKAPTVLISGIPMHRIKNTDPSEDTRRKVRSIAPIVGSVLDTATGLGYTAIEAARTAERVVTIELDPTVQDVGRLNPWSRALFDNPKIELRYGDSFDVVQDLPDGSFSRVIHDPPTFALAGQLYSTVFYRELYRVLKRGGRLFHYVGDAQSPSGGRVTRGVVRRLQEAGFTRVSPRAETFGVVAQK